MLTGSKGRAGGPSRGDIFSSHLAHGLPSSALGKFHVLSVPQFLYVHFRMVPLSSGNGPENEIN